MNKENLMESLVSLEKSTKKMLDKQMNKIGIKFGLSKQEIFVLFLLTKDKSIKTASSIVKNQGFSKSYISKVISSLNNKKYIHLENKKGDRHYQEIKLLSKCDSLIKEFDNINEKSIKILINNIEDNDFDIFIKVMNKIIYNARNYEEVA